MKRYILIFGLFILGMYSCDKRTVFDKAINNSSTYDIVVYKSNVNSSGIVSADSILIKKNTEANVFFESDFNKADTYSDCKGKETSSKIDSVKVISSSIKSLVYDINSTSKWIYSKKDKYNCDCELQILDFDIQ